MAAQNNLILEWQSYPGLPFKGPNRIVIPRDSLPGLLLDVVKPASVLENPGEDPNLVDLERLLPEDIVEAFYNSSVNPLALIRFKLQTGNWFYPVSYQNPNKYPDLSMFRRFISFVDNTMEGELLPMEDALEREDEDDYVYDYSLPEDIIPNYVNLRLLEEEDAFLMTQQR